MKKIQILKKEYLELTIEKYFQTEAQTMKKNMDKVYNSYAKKTLEPKQKDMSHRMGDHSRAYK